MNKEGELVVIDFKSGKGVYDQHALQLAAYCKALEETCECKSPVRNAYVLHFDKEKADFEYKRVEDVDVCFSYFLDCLHLHTLTKQPYSMASLFQKDLFAVCCVLNNTMEVAEEDLSTFCLHPTYGSTISSKYARKSISFQSFGNAFSEVVDLVLYLCQFYPWYALEQMGDLL